MAYDYKKAAGDKASFGSAYIRGKSLDIPICCFPFIHDFQTDLLFSGMYRPTEWPKLAEDIKSAAAVLINATSETPPTKRSFELPHTPALRRQGSSNSSDPAPDYAFQAVTCSDAIDAGNVTTQMVFDELVRVTRDVSQMCKLFWSMFCPAQLLICSV
jgi:hypothetical protein